MSEVNEMASKRSKRSDAKQDLLLSDTRQDLLQQYGCGPIQFSGTNDALYERHLLFDDIVAPTAAGAREQFEAAARLGNGGLGRLAACFLDSMATMQLPAMGYGLRYEYGIFKQSIQDGWQHEQPDNWLRRPDPWEVARPHETVEVKLGCSFELRGGTLRAVTGRSSTLIGVPFDRPVVGYGGKTINTLRLWAASAHDYFNF